MEAKRMEVKTPVLTDKRDTSKRSPLERQRMGVKTPVLTDKRGVTDAFAWLRSEGTCRAVKTGVLTSMR